MGRFSRGAAARLAPTAPTVPNSIERMAPNQLKKKKNLFNKKSFAPTSSPLMKAFGK